MNDLIKISNKYKSTKSRVKFFEIYHNYFNSLRDSNIKILEIGIDKGESLRIWREYFSKAKICGIDINPIDFKIDGVDIIKADQTNLEDLKRVCEKYKNFDIIIDDGGHHSHQIITSFNFLFDFLNNDGLYIVEDLQTSYFPRFGGSRFKLNRSKTSMNFIKSLTDSINYEQNDKPFFKNKKFDGLIKHVHFYQNIAVIKKGITSKFFYENSSPTNSFIDKIKKIFSYFNFI